MDDDGPDYRQQQECEEQEMADLLRQEVEAEQYEQSQLVQQEQYNGAQDHQGN